MSLFPKKVECSFKVSAHHASCPAVYNLSQAKLELGHKVFSSLSYPTIPLQLTNTLCHIEHLIDALQKQENGKNY